MANPFNHAFTSKNVEGMNGYIAALNQVMIHIGKETEYMPSKRLIDSVKLLDRIGDTVRELQPIMEQAQIELNELINKIPKQ